MTNKTRKTKQQNTLDPFPETPVDQAARDFWERAVFAFMRYGVPEGVDVWRLADLSVMEWRKRFDDNFRVTS